MARSALLGQWRTAGDAQGLAVDVAGLLRGEENVGWGEFGRLGGAPHGGLRLAKLRDLLRG